MKVTQKMPTKRQSKDNWTCKICKRENSETLYFVCSACIEDIKRNHIHKEKEKQDEQR